MATVRHKGGGYTNGQAANTTTYGPGDTPLGYVSTSGTVTATTAAALEGSIGFELAGAAGDVPAVGYGGWASDTIAVSCLMKVPSAPASGQQRVLNVYAVDTFSGALPRFELNSDGRLLTRNAAGTTVAAASTGTGVSIVGKKCHLQLWVAKGTTTSDGQMRVKITDLDASTVLVDSGLLTGLNTGTVQFQATRIGRPSTHATYAATLLVDAIAASDTATGLLDALEVPVDAGIDQVVDPLTTVTLAATGSGSWSQVSGGTVTLGGSGATRTFTAPAAHEQEEYVFAYGGDETTVTVRPHNEWQKSGGGLVPVQWVAA